MTSYLYIIISYYCHCYIVCYYCFIVIIIILIITIIWTDWVVLYALCHCEDLKKWYNKKKTCRSTTNYKGGNNYEENDDYNKNK